MKGHFMRHLPFGLIIVALLTGLMMVAIPADSFKSNTQTQSIAPVPGSQLLTLVPQEVGGADQTVISNTEALGLVLYTDYFLAFELAAVILLVAIISAITLVHRHAIRSKRQDIKKQIMTRSEDRVSLVSIKSEK
jgi:NADH-quinone oxidoreductase subunit J